MLGHKEIVRLAITDRKTLLKFRFRTEFWWESPKERDDLKDRGIDGWMGSKWILGRLVGRAWSAFTWLRIRTDASSCKHGDEHSGSGAMDLVF
jgi:hypothetical protein